MIKKEIRWLHGDLFFCILCIQGNYIEWMCVPVILGVKLSAASRATHGKQVIVEGPDKVRFNNFE